MLISLYLTKKAQKGLKITAILTYNSMVYSHKFNYNNKLVFGMILALYISMISNKKDYFSTKLFSKGADNMNKDKKTFQCSYCLNEFVVNSDDDKIANGIETCKKCHDNSVIGSMIGYIFEQLTKEQRVVLTDRLKKLS
jgi:ribosomal protein L37AE/L43A